MIISSFAYQYIFFIQAYTLSKPSLTACIHKIPGTWYLVRSTSHQACNYGMTNKICLLLLINLAVVLQNYWYSNTVPSPVCFVEPKATRAWTPAPPTVSSSGCFSSLSLLSSIASSRQSPWLRLYLKNSLRWASR